MQMMSESGYVPGPETETIYRNIERILGVQIIRRSSGARSSQG